MSRMRFWAIRNLSVVSALPLAPRNPRAPGLRLLATNPTLPHHSPSSPRSSVPRHTSDLSSRSLLSPSTTQHLIDCVALLPPSQPLANRLSFCPRYFPPRRLHHHLLSSNHPITRMT
ncbi:uncharacterized protein BKA78DRAFT_33371 [Phyllosticta capitalensis]|uniref:uncharacterized protein n=1 Tax=Phyllosticta capitalensis TaxID=121624 RepID=UPI00312DE6A4